VERRSYMTSQFRAAERERNVALLVVADALRGELRWKARFVDPIGHNSTIGREQLQDSGNLEYVAKLILIFVLRRGKLHRPATRSGIIIKLSLIYIN